MRDPFNNEPAASRITVRDALAPLSRHRRIAIAGFLAAFALINALAWIWAANYYKAHMQIVVEQSRTDPVVTAGQDSSIIGGRQITTDQVSSEVALLQGTDMLQSAAQSCGLVEPAKQSIWSNLFASSPQEGQAIRLASATAKLARRLTVEATPTSDVIDVNYGHRGSPETPACVLRQLARLYVDKHLHLRRQAGSAILFAEQTDRFKQALTDSEARLIEFSRSTGSGDPEDVQVAMSQELASAEFALYRAQEASVAGEGRIRDVRSQMQIVPQRSAAGRQETPAYYLIQNLQENLLSAQLKRTQLLVKYDPSFPLVKEVDQEIQETARALEQARKTTYLSESTDRDGTFEFLRQDMAKSEADVAQSKASTAAIKARINGMRSEMVKLEEQAIRHAALAREVKANETKYLLYLNKLEQERISEALDQKRVADVAIAVSPEVPALPAYNPLFIFAAGTLFAAIVGMSLAYIAEYMDPFLRTPEDVDREIGVPVLAAFSPRAA
ncbi:MAG: GumC family protein [Bryobacteraceae bacterium]